MSNPAMPSRCTALSRCLLAAVAGLFLSAAAAAEELVVYTAAGEADLAKIESAYLSAHPGMSIRWERDSSARIAQRLIDESSAPKADVVWALAATELAGLAERNLLLPHTPPNFAAIDAGLGDSARPPHWLGLRAWTSGICFNPTTAAAQQVPRPASWNDLLKPAYQGRILMPHPGATATGYMVVANWIRQMGEAAAWTFMDALHRNIAAYMASGTRPCTMAALTHEYPVGLSYSFLAARMQAKEEPVEAVVPREPLAWDVEGVAILRGTTRQAAAKAFVDWSVSEAADRLYKHDFAVTVRPGGPSLKHLPADLRQRMAPTDFGWLAANRDRILTEWRRRYDEKSEPQAKRAE
ncbi:MAG: extracellular solute-binding protein [Alphaproteobacteria bacterium]